MDVHEMLINWTCLPSMLLNTSYELLISISNVGRYLRDTKVEEIRIGILGSFFQHVWEGGEWLRLIVPALR